MEQIKPDYEEVKINLGEYVKVLIKRQTFIAVFLVVLASGVTVIQLTPRIYRVSMSIQPPVNGERSSGVDDLESAENLRGMVVNNVFTGALSEKLKSPVDIGSLAFAVTVPEKTNILQISVDMEAKNKEFGVKLLQNLADVISASYVKPISAKISEINQQVRQKESSIGNAKEKAKNLQDQIKEITAREDKLKDELTTINTNTAQILAKREGLMKENATAENESILLLTNFIQNNLSYSNQLNNQFSDLSIRRVNLGLEIKNIDSQISDLQMGIDKLNSSKDFISNVRIIGAPRVSVNPVSPGKKRILGLSIVLGLLAGALLVFLQEFWTTIF